MVAIALLLLSAPLQTEEGAVPGLCLKKWTGIGSTAINDLTGKSAYPDSLNQARGTAALAVQAVANPPLAFSPLDVGAFEKRLTSISVRTDAKGVGRAKFTATEGTTGDVNVLAACPLAGGQVHF